MRKLLIISALLTASIVSVAQERKPWFDPWDLYVGPKAGIAYSNLSSLGGDAKIGLNAGVFVESHITERFAICFDMMYARVGSDNVYHNNIIPNEDGSLPSTGPYYYKFDFLNTQYKLRYYVMKNLNVFTGLHLSRVVKAKSIVNDVESKIKKDIRSGDLLIPFGAEFSFKNLAIEATYYLPLRKLAKSDRAMNLLGNAKQNLITVTLAYKIQMF